MTVIERQHRVRRRVVHESVETVDAGGNLYSTTASGGAHSDPDCHGSCGTAFRLAPDGTETILHDFAWKTGAFPWSGVIMDRKGNLFGTTLEGGSRIGIGTVFEITP